MRARDFLAGHPLLGRPASFGGAMIAPARVAAYEILLAISGGRADLPSAIARARASLADERDRALAAEIATGVQRWRASLDYVIGHVAKRPIERLDPEIVEILRLSTYQLLHLSRVPASAVVDDAVKLARRAGKRSADGFVNAVLRTVSRQRNALPLPSRPARSSGSRAGARILQPHALASRVAGRALVRSPGICGSRGVDAVRQCGCPAHPARQSNPHAARRTGQPPSRTRRRRRPRQVRARCADRRGRPSAPGARTGGRLVRCPGRGLSARGAARRAVAGPTCARHMRRSRRQDDGVCRRQSRRVDRRLRRQGTAHRTAAAHRRGNRRGERGARSGRPVAATSLHRSVRLRGGRCAVLGSGHAPARSGHPVAAARSGSGCTGRSAAHHAASRRGGCDAWRQARLRDVFERTGGERRTWSRRFSRPLQGSLRSMRVRLTRHCRRTPSTIAATFGPSPIATVSRGSSGRSW